MRTLLVLEHRDWDSIREHKVSDSLPEVRTSFELTKFELTIDYGRKGKTS